MKTTARLVSAWAVLAVLFTGLFLVGIFIATGIVIWSGQFVNSYPVGFFFTAALLLTVFTFLSVYAKGILRIIRNKMVVHIYKDEAVTNDKAHERSEEDRAIPGSSFI